MARQAKAPGATAGEPRTIFFGYQAASNAVYRVAEGEAAPRNVMGSPGAGEG